MSATEEMRRGQGTVKIKSTHNLCPWNTKDVLDTGVDKRLDHNVDCFRAWSHCGGESAFRCQLSRLAYSIKVFLPSYTFPSLVLGPIPNY